MSEFNDYRLGSIWLIQFDPSVGTEIRKTRPGMVISGDIFNAGRSKVTVLPLTSVKLNQNISTKITPALVQISPSNQNGLSVESLLVCIDPATFDKRRFIKCLGQIEKELLIQAQSTLRRYLCL